LSPVWMVMICFLCDRVVGSLMIPQALASFRS